MVAGRVREGRAISYNDYYYYFRLLLHVFQKVRGIQIPEKARVTEIWSEHEMKLKLKKEL